MAAPVKSLQMPCETAGHGDLLLLDVNQVAAKLGCSARHVWRLADAGEMPAPIKLRRKVKWSVSALTEWIDDGCKPVRTISRRAA